MKKLLCIIGALCTFNAFSDFVHPMDFDGSQAQKDEVNDYIARHLQNTYCIERKDSCDMELLGIMAQENVRDFIKATKATDRTKMDNVIKDFCLSGIDLCNYTNIWSAYKQDIKSH